MTFCYNNYGDTMIDELQLTVQVNMSYEELDKILTEKGLSCVNKKYQHDLFMIKADEDLSGLADFEKLSRTIIIRDVENEFKGYIYKKSTFDVLTATLKKSSVKVDLIDLNQGYCFLEALGYKKYFALSQNLVEYANTTNKICVSIIKDLGVFVEIHGHHSNYQNGTTSADLKRILDFYVPNIMNRDYYVSKPIMMIRKLSDK